MGVFVPDVDMTKIKSGSAVTFRNGGKNTVQKVEYNGLPLSHPYLITFEGYDYPFYFSRKGRWAEGKMTPWDIVNISPPPFDWSKVKPGDKFKLTSNSPCYSGKVFTYIGMDSFIDGSVVVQAQDGNLYSMLPCLLTHIE